MSAILQQNKFSNTNHSWIVGNTAVRIHKQHVFWFQIRMAHFHLMKNWNKQQMSPKK